MYVLLLKNALAVDLGGPSVFQVTLPWTPDPQVWGDCEPKTIETEEQLALFAETLMEQEEPDEESLDVMLVRWQVDGGFKVLVNVTGYYRG